MKANKKWIALLILVIVLLGASCNKDGDSEPTQPVFTVQPSVQEPTQAPASQVTSGKARVESIEIFIMESFPVQVNVLAKGNLPDGCTKIDQINKGSDSNTLWVEITTLRPADAMCTEALVPFEENIGLDVYGLLAGTYSVDVNGVTDTFTLSVDNAPQGEEDTPLDPAEATEPVTGVFVAEYLGDLGLSFTRPENWMLVQQPGGYGLVPPDAASPIISFAYVPGISTNSFDALVQAMTAHLEAQGESGFTFDLDAFGEAQGVLVYDLQGACRMFVAPGGGSVRTVTVGMEACDASGQIVNQIVNSVLESLTALEPTE